MCLKSPLALALKPNSHTCRGIGIIKAEVVEQLPVSLNCKGKIVAVAGGGTGAARKAELALRAGAYVRVFADVLSEDFRTIVSHSRLTHVPRSLQRADIEDCFLVFSATGEEAEDRAVWELARQVKAYINVTDVPALCDFTMPSIVDRDPLLIAISTAGASPIFARMLRARLESTMPAAYGKLVTLTASFRERVAQAIGKGGARRRFWEDVLEGPVLDRVLEGRDLEAKLLLEDALASAVSGSHDDVQGEVYLVGAGPGDPDLLTFRGLRLMQRADVVLYDRLISSAILNLVRRDAEQIYVGKLPDDHVLPQDEITAKMIALARQGKRVLRLKGGDPFMFGRGGEEIEGLAEAGIPFQVVPGITAANGCAAYAGIPLTHRDHAQACIFVTGHGQAGGGLTIDWPALLQPRQTVAIFMGLGHIEELMRGYVHHGGNPTAPAAIIDNGTRPEQRVVTGTVQTMASLASQAGLKGPALIIIGTVVTLRERLQGSFPSALEIKQVG